MKLVLFALPLVFATQVFAHDMPNVTMPKDFDALKHLVGTWEGTGMMHGKEEKLTLVYELTSGGTAITEKFMSGTPHEMTSIYYKQGKSLAMTHYCAMGNHPELALKNADASHLSFEMTKPVGLSSANEPHMHALTLTMADADHLTEEWTSYEGGKKQGTVLFKFQRKK